MLASATDRIGLPGGLRMRRSTCADAEALAAFNSGIHTEPGHPRVSDAVGVWTRDLLAKPHPTFDPGDFVIVEEAATGRIVSSSNLIGQQWVYDGLPVRVGRIELVGTDPEYRGRGLVREQFRVLHSWSAARGHLLQAITGIPFFYRQFGYEMALDLDIRRPGLPLALEPGPSEASPEFVVRPALETDLAFIGALYKAGVQRYLMSCTYDDDGWRYVLLGRDPRSLVHDELRVVRRASGEPVGFYAYSPLLWSGSITAHLFELASGVPYSAVTPVVARSVLEAGKEVAAREGASCTGFSFCLGYDHPAYDACPHLFGPPRGSYTWYARIPDLAAFLQTATPVLERRLAASALSGYTGALTLGFYRDGLRLAFEAGRVAAIEPWMPTPSAGGDAQFPNLTFLQLLLGHRTLAELGHAYADCCVDNRVAAPLLTALFPRRSSYVWPLG